MQILLTFDYELFFGSSSGSIEKCMIEPSQRLMNIAKNHEIKLVFFVDIGYYIQLKKYNFPELKKDKILFENQIREMIALGHDVQLHIHPHWEKASYADGKWHFDMTNCYKLADFEEDERIAIVKRYKAELDDLTQLESHTFRAGGWCIQPFSNLEKVFKTLGIKIDSSVFAGAKFESAQYFFDFSSAPKKAIYRFQSDVNLENHKGDFIELPITSYKYSPLFYWKLYGLGRLFPSQHKMIGDGTFLAQPGRKKSVLTHFTWNHASVDGYYASMLNKITSQQKEKDYMVVIGHPKGMTEFAFKKMEQYIIKQKKTHSFITYSDVLSNFK